MPTDADLEFGEIALKNELITRDQHRAALTALKQLESRLKKQGKLKKKRPRLVDVMVQKDFLSGLEAKRVEKARRYRTIRQEDKLYGRIVLKSKFCKPKQVAKALDAQRDAYRDGDDPERVATILLDKNYLTEEQDEAIQEVMKKLKVGDYFGKKKSKRNRAAEEDDELELDEDDASEEGSGLSDDLDEDGSGDELDESDDLGSDMSGVDEGLELDLDAGSGPLESLDDVEELEKIDSQIDEDLDDLEDSDLDFDDDPSSIDARRDTDTPAPRGLSSEDVFADDDLGSDSEDLVSDSSEGDIDLEELDLASSDLDLD